MPSAVAKPEHGSVEWSGPPASFDQFVIDRELGKGGMGRVYLARDTTLDRLVALKFIAVTDPSAQARGRFLVEARAIAKVSHPNVVAVYRVGEVQERPYIAYEFVSGQSLDRLALPLPWETTLRLAVGLAAGLDAAHREGILHRDIKPANVVLSERGEIKLLDFGLAKLKGVIDESPDPAQLQSREGPAPPAQLIANDALGAKSITAQTRNITRQGSLMGTPAYMAPELWWGEAASPRSDVWALGLVLHVLLIGSLPYAALEGEELTFAIVERDIPSIHGLRPEVPASFSDIIARCLCREASERFPSATELVKALDEVRAVFLPLTGALGAVQLEPERLAVAASLARMSSRMRALTKLLYERLFAEHPSMRVLFPENLSAQQDKLAHALKLSIDGLEDPERLAVILEDLGRRHACYGVFAEHFDALRSALLGALAETDATDWNPTLERGWKRAYAFIEGAMRRGLVVEQKTVMSSPALPRLLTQHASGLPRTRYAPCGDLSIAYQVFGTGPVDLVVMFGWVSHLELMWQHPSLSGFLHRLARFARVIVFDKRGTGMSDRAFESMTAADRIADLEAVLNAAGSKQAVLLGITDGAGTACMFAAEHPSRVSRLVLYAASAEPPGGFEEAITTIRAEWGDPVFIARDAPSMAANAAFRNWLALYLRMSASPGTAIAMLKLDARLDLAKIAPAVGVPTLVLHRTGDGAVPFAAGKDLATRIPGARFVELAGVDHLPFVGEVEPLCAAVEAFVKADIEDIG